MSIPVLIVAECNVNVKDISTRKVSMFVLIVAECNVNKIYYKSIFIITMF